MEKEGLKQNKYLTLKQTIMTKKIEKIHIIDAPTENVLTDNELLDFLGGDNCGSYDDSSCMWNKKTSCVEFSGGTACDGVEDAVKCGTYTTDPTIVN